MTWCIIEANRREGAIQMNLNTWFEKGLTADQYIDAMKVNQEGLKSIYQAFEVPAGEENDLTQLREQHLRVIVLTEDWCGDAMVNVPILLKLAERSGMEVRMVLRDQNLELMDQYLTNGTARAIPIFIFIDEDGNEKAVWGPRAETVQRYVEEQRSKLPPKDDERFEEKQKEMYKAMMSRYTEDETVWNDIFYSIKHKLPVS